MSIDNEITKLEQEIVDKKAELVKLNKAKTTFDGLPQHFN